MLPDQFQTSVRKFTKVCLVEHIFWGGYLPLPKLNNRN